MNHVAITFVDSGLESVEVSDDGHGIAADDMSLIGQRHHTSKITNEMDVLRVKTFGFRGEALHSLAALSEDLTVTSLTENGTGFRVTLSKDIDSVVPVRVTCSKGTTVKIRGLLKALPVRHAEWQRNSKRHFVKALWLIQSYILALPTIRIRCVNAGRTQQTLFTSTGSGDVNNAFTEAFSGELRGTFQKTKCNGTSFDCELYFSPSARRSADRQFSFINDRPCDLPRIFKRLNEISRTHSIDGSPIFLLYITTGDIIDVNLTPDKRQVMVPFEQELIDALAVQPYISPNL